MRGEAMEACPLFAETGLRLNGAPESNADSRLDYPSVLGSLIVDSVDGSLVLDPRLERRVVEAKQRQIRTERFKLIYTPLPHKEHVGFELYNVAADPDNRRNLYGLQEYEREAESLKRGLFDWMLEEPGTGLDQNLHLVRWYNFFE